MDDYVIMPQADYKDACDATREKTGGTELLKSGELGAAIRGIQGGDAFNPLNYCTMLPRFDISEIIDFPDPFVLKCPNATAMGTVFNTRSVNFENMEVYMKEGTTITGGMLAGSGGFKPSGVKKISVRCGESRTVKFANSIFHYLANSPTVETLDFVIDLSLYAKINGSQWFGAALINAEFAPNSINGYSYNFFNNTPNLSDDTLISVANALKGDSVATFTLEATPKARCDAILGTVSTVIGDVSYDFFTRDDAGDTTLTEFITNVKGWTLA